MKFAFWVCLSLSQSVARAKSKKCLPLHQGLILTLYNFYFSSTPLGGPLFDFSNPLIDPNLVIEISRALVPKITSNIGSSSKPKLIPTCFNPSKEAKKNPSSTPPPRKVDVLEYSEEEEVEDYESFDLESKWSPTASKEVLTFPLIMRPL